jgi:type II secretory pathway pseudopilin PulG
MRLQFPGAFTLVELLVVITIIVVLLSLLAPAMDKAVYEAELAVCGANLKGLATAVTAYSGEHRRTYPFHQTYQDPGMRPIYLNWSYNGYDDRPLLSKYVSINKNLQCPLAGAMGLEAQENDADTQAITSYEMWFGWKWQAPGAGGGMTKLGDRMGWNGYEFDVLASDIDAQEDGVGYFQTAHPDRDGRLINKAGRNEDSTGLNVVFKFTARFWITPDANTVGRGTIDRHFAHEDTSVERMKDLKEGDDLTEKRTVDLPHFGNNGNRWRGYLPR